jgi:cytidine deaminase
MDIAASLLDLARQFRQNAYDPYTQYPVGAAILDENGDLHGGFNVGNASAGLGICAERTAIFSMLLSGGRRIKGMALVTRNGGSPCGACRQVMREFAEDFPVWISDEAGRTVQSSLAELLPRSFGPDSMD